MPGQKGTSFPIVIIGDTRCVTGQLILRVSSGCVFVNETILRFCSCVTEEMNDLSISTYCIVIMIRSLSCCFVIYYHDICSVSSEIMFHL
jgi:hypothetical protein